MDAEKYNRSIGLNCPTCGCELFQTGNAVDEAIEFIECASCGRQMTKDELLHENSENLSMHVQEVGKEMMADAVKDFEKSLKAAFGGSKFFKLK